MTKPSKADFDQRFNTCINSVDRIYGQYHHPRLNSDDYACVLDYLQSAWGVAEVNIKDASELVSEAMDILVEYRNSRELRDYGDFYPQFNACFNTILHLSMDMEFAIYLEGKE